MALSDRDIIITPNRGASTEPTILFRGADASSSASITLRVINSGTVGTLSFEGTSGQLFSLTDSMSGTIFSANDVSGIPSIEVLDTGLVKIAQYSGYATIGGTGNYTNATSTTSGVLQVVGGAGIGRDLYVGGTIYGNLSGSVTNTTNSAITNETASATVHYPVFVSGISGNLPLKVDNAALVWVPSTNRLGIGTTSPTSRLHVAGAGNTTGGNIHLGDDVNGTAKWTYITGAHYNGATNLTGFSLIGGYSDASSNRIVIGGSIYESNPATEIQFWTHTATTHATGGSQRMVIDTNGNVGINITSPTSRLHVREAGATISSGNAINGTSMRGIMVDNTNNDDTSVGLWFSTGPGSHWSGISGQRTNSAANWGTDLRFYTHEDATNDITYSRERLRISSNGNLGIGTSDFSYTSSDNTAVVAGGIDANKVFVNGSIQLLGNNNAIVFGRGTSSFFKDEEIGFGWGGGWYMLDGTYLRSRNNKHVYNENIFSGSQFQGYSTSYNKETFIQPRWQEPNFAFGIASDDSSYYWTQAMYYGTGTNTRGFRVKNSNGGGIVFAVNEKVIATQNPIYKTWQSYTGSDNGPMKTWDGVLVAGSDYSGASTYTVIETNVPQDSYMMGGFTINWFENYSSTNAKTDITLSGYWNPESNGGFIGFEYTTSNPYIVPTIQVGRNTSNGKTVFILSHFNSSYAIITARDLWLGYSGGSYDYGSGWTISQTSSLAAYTNLDSVVPRTAVAGSAGVGSGLNADLLDGIDSSGFRRQYSATVAFNQSYTAAFNIDGNNLASGCSLFIEGTTGNVVVSAYVSIVVSHSQKIQVQSQSGQYTQVTVRVVSDGNNNATVYIKGDTSGNATVSSTVTVSPYGNETITMNPGSVYSSVSHEHICRPGFAFSGYGQTGDISTDANIYIDRTSNGVRLFNVSGSGGLGVQNIASTSGDLQLYGSDGNWKGEYYGDGSSQGFLDSNWGNWDLRKAINGQLYVRVSGAEQQVLTAGNFASIIGSTYVPQNPDGDGIAWSYSDENPVINGVSIGGGQRFGSDGSPFEGFLQAKILNARNGFVNSANGYYIGNYDFGANSNTYSTTQVIDSAGNFYGPRFYDSANNGYYADPASTSNFSGLTVANSITAPGVDGYSRRLDNHTRSAFTVGGNASTFYPVVFNIGAGATAQQYGEFMIERGGYDDPGYTGVNFSTFNLRMSVKASGWGFGSTYENCEALYQNVQLVANWQQVSESSRLIIWLRGATAYNYYNIVGSTSLYNANAAGGNIVESNPAYYTYTFTPTTTIQPKAQHSKYFNSGAMFDSSCRIYSLGLGTNASGTQGEIRATNEITAYYSDRRLKTNVQVIDNAIDKVKKLTGITYTGNEIASEHGYDINKRQAGVFADEVESVLPEIVRPAPFDIDDQGGSKSGEHYKTVQYEKLVPLLIEAIKEQSKIIEDQGRKIAEHEELINKLLGASK
jgi:hypothetical protein